MRRLALFEYETREAVPLNAVEVQSLREAVPSLTVTPSLDGLGYFDITPGSDIGVVIVPGLEVEIRPKIGVDAVLFLLSYAMDPSHWRDQAAHFAQSPHLVETVIPGFLYHVERALAPGVLQGYRTVEETGATVRGRIRFSEQLRRHYGRQQPIEVMYDDFTRDIEINRLLKAAIIRLGRLPLRVAEQRRRLHHQLGRLSEVALVEYDARKLPEMLYDRLSERYRPAVELAKLILRATSFDIGSLDVKATGFLIDMNEVFERFVVIALREALELSERTLRQGAQGKQMRLDVAGNLRLKPDLSWWDGRICRFVGDVKYKDLAKGGVRQDDLYQILAYSIAAALPSSMLIYAAGDPGYRAHEVVNLGKQLMVEVLDVQGAPDEILERVARLGERIRDLANEQPRGISPIPVS